MTAPTLTQPAAQVCESCRHAPASTTWAHPAAGAPFALCQSCAALTTSPADDAAAGRSS